MRDLSPTMVLIESGYQDDFIYTRIHISTRAQTRHCGYEHLMARLIADGFLALLLASAGATRKKVARPGDQADEPEFEV